MSTQEEMVTRLEYEVGHALAHCDTEALQRLFANDFIGTNPMSIEMTKADVIAQIGSHNYEAESIVNEVRRVRIFGDVAIVMARGAARGKYKGQRADMVFLYTRIWVKRDDLWQAVAAHASPLSDKA